MEELLKQLITGQKQLYSEIKDLIAGQQEFKTEIKGMVAKLDNLESEIALVKQDMGTNIQQRENTDIIKAILHHQESANAVIESLRLHTATCAHVEKVEAKIDNLNVRLFDQEAEITRLKVAK